MGENEQLQDCMQAELKVDEKLHIDLDLNLYR